MKKRFLLFLPLFFLALLSLFACGEETPTNNTGNPTSAPIQNGSGRLSRISIDFTGMKITYVLGEELDFTGLVVNATYSDGTSQAVTDYTYETNYNPNEIGDYTVKVIYTEDGVTKTRSFYTKVTSILQSLDKYVIGIMADTTNVKTKYAYQETFTTEGLTVTAYYSDGSKEALTSNDFTVDSSKYDSENRGDYEIVVKYSKTYTSGGHSEVVNADTCYFASLLLTMTKIQFGGGTRNFKQYSNVSTSDWKVRVYFAEKTEYDTITEGFKTNIVNIIPDANTATSGSVKVTIMYTYNGVTCTVDTNCSVVAPNAQILPGALDLCDMQFQDLVLDSTFTVLYGYSVLAETSTCGTQAFAKSIAFTGTGTLKENSIKVSLTGKATIHVCAASTEGTRFGLYDANGDAVQTVYAGTNNERYEFTAPTAGTYYIWCDTAISIYYVGVWY